MRILRIFLRPERRKPVIDVYSAVAVVGLGLDGDHFSKPNGKRQITIFSVEDWDDACAELNKELDPSLRRANLLVSDACISKNGLAFDESSVGRVLCIGDVRIQIAGETKPCRLMDESYSGLKDALEPAWRGGVYGEILDGGKINVGDLISCEPLAEPSRIGPRPL